jgi:hydrogenase maturation protease
MIATPPRILVAGIGNIFFGDDAFGVHAARALARRTLPPGVRVIDFGIRGLDLVYALLDGCELAILLDAVPRGEAPGTLFVIEPEPPPNQAPHPHINGHSMDPLQVIATAAAMGGGAGRMLLVGCEPVPIDPTLDIQVGLSPHVAAAIEPAADMVESLILQHAQEVHHASSVIRA